MTSDSDSDGVAPGGVSPPSLAVGHTKDPTQFGLGVQARCSWCPRREHPVGGRPFLALLQLAASSPTGGPVEQRRTRQRLRHPGLSAVLARPAEEALDEEQAVAAVQQAMALEAAEEEHDWLLSSNDDDGDGDGGDAAVIDLTEED
ncbi:hypothetical protein ZWY2020_010113 [Hordeum vulgare]|nr:hypothetical protein ZWY2020_010113 [Hordeum vulgare]